jgi:3-dehydroquinate dehydratase/shikimate dehydrogenase
VISRICETVTGATMAEICERRDRATSADLVELRLDGVADVDIPRALAGRTRPVIVTLRAKWEGGFFDGPEETRLKLLAQAIELGAEYVDVEFRAERRSLPRCEGTQLIVSRHDFEGVPADLSDQVRAMRQAGGDIVKMAVMAQSLDDCLRLREAMPPDEGRPQIAIAMGPAGQVTRTCPARFGSEWTYGGQAAPGQLSVADLVKTFRVREVSSSTPLYAVAGWPLAHSASPAMHNAAFANLGMDAVYVALPTADADELLRLADALGIVGLSVTAPLKEAVFARAAQTDDVSQKTGASNSLRRAVQGWDARNFDVDGFLAPLDGRTPALEGARAVVLGAGGAARVAIWALAGRGARVEVAARRPERAAALAAEFGVTASSWPPSPGWTWLVNTTPVGTWPDVAASPLDRAHVAGQAVYDLVYNPAETTLLRMAREAGAEVVGGLDMLVAQAARQFQWWTGREPSTAVMHEAAARFIAKVTGQDDEADHV